jgi:hypothetical protein
LKAWNPNRTFRYLHEAHKKSPDTAEMHLERNVIAGSTDPCVYG